MRSRTARTNAARIIGVGISLLTLGACDRSVTAPDSGRAVRPSAAAHDDDPPPFLCRSGWTMADGRWTCADG